MSLREDLERAQAQLRAIAYALDGEGKVGKGDYAWTETLGRVREMRSLLNAPEIFDFVKAVHLEAAHQRQRWGSAHDEGKTDADWFWLIGFLAGKALHNPGGEPEKQLHRIVTVAAAAANWHAARLGTTDMRPGIATPKGEST